MKLKFNPGFKELRQDLRFLKRKSITDTAFLTERV
jgi:hypothetical protein